MTSSSKLARPLPTHTTTSPPVAKQNISTNGKGKPRGHEDAFEDFDPSEYHHMTAAKRSIFSKLFTNIGLRKTADEYKRCWDHLRTKNFQVAGDWYLNVRYRNQTPWGWPDISGATLRRELQEKWDYQRMPLTECLHLGPRQAAARYVRFLVDEECQDPESFVHGLGENKVTFVVDLFLKCRFGTQTHNHALTKMLFPLTRNGDWRWKHLSSNRSTKRGGASISDHNTDDKEGSGITESQAKRIRTYQARGSRYSSERESTEDFVEPSSSTSVCPSGETLVKLENRNHLSSTDASSQKTPTSTTEPSVFEPSATSPPQPDSQVLTPKAASFPAKAAQEFHAPTVSPLSSYVLRDTASAESKLTGFYPTTISAESARMQRRTAELEEEARDREVTVSQLHRRVSEQEAEIQKQEQKINDMKALRKEANDSMTARDQQIAELSEEITKARQVLLEKDQDITELEEAVAEVGRLVSKCRNRVHQET